MKDLNILICEGNTPEEGKIFQDVGIPTHTESLKESLAYYNQNLKIDVLNPCLELNLNEIVNKTHEKVCIELNSNYNLEELKNVLKEEGKTQIRLLVVDKNKSFSFELEKTRKFDLNIFNSVKNKEYVKKISF